MLWKAWLRTLEYGLKGACNTVIDFDFRVNCKYAKLRHGKTQTNWSLNMSHVWKLKHKRTWTNQPTFLNKDFSKNCCAIIVVDAKIYTRLRCLTLPFS
jgi:hypothetical protein